MKHSTFSKACDLYDCFLSRVDSTTHHSEFLAQFLHLGTAGISPDVPWRAGWETAPSLEPLFQPKRTTQFSAESCSIQSYCLIASWAHHTLYRFPKSDVDCSQVHLPYKGSDMSCPMLPVPLNYKVQEGNLQRLGHGCGDVISHDRQGTSPWRCGR